MLTVLVAAIAPALAMAAPNTLLEKSATYALDNQYRSYRVPTPDSTGKIKYYDVTVKLTVGPTGIIAPSAIVTATLSPNIASMIIAPGSYDRSRRYDLHGEKDHSDQRPDSVFTDMHQDCGHQRICRCHRPRIGRTSIPRELDRPWHTDPA